MFAVNRRVLSLNEIQRQAPSVFATAPHEAVSDKYRFIPTVEMLHTLMKEGWEPIQAAEHRVRNASKAGFQKHLLRFRNPNLPKIGEREIDLLVFNSHDRTTGFQFRAGVYEFVCANGLVVGESLFSPLSVKHIGYQANNVIEASYRLIDSVPRIAQSIESMRSVQLGKDERVALANSALIAKYGEPTPDNVVPIRPEALLVPRRREDCNSDLWTTFNVIQENAINGGQRGRSGSGRRMRTRPVGSISENTKLNQALWSLAEEMKRLKTL